MGFIALSFWCKNTQPLFSDLVQNGFKYCQIWFSKNCFLKRFHCNVCQNEWKVALYRNTSHNSRATIRWIGVSVSKNVTPISHPTPISSALANSKCGGCHILMSRSRWYGISIVSIPDFGKKILTKTYPTVIHVTAWWQLGEVLLYPTVIHLIVWWQVVEVLQQVEVVTPLCFTS